MDGASVLASNIEGTSTIDDGGGCLETAKNSCTDVVILALDKGNN